MYLYHVCRYVGMYLCMYVCTKPTRCLSSLQPETLRKPRCEAVRLANDTPYGLANAVGSLASELRAGWEQDLDDRLPHR